MYIYGYNQLSILLPYIPTLKLCKLSKLTFEESSKNAFLIQNLFLVVLRVQNYYLFFIRQRVLRFYFKLEIKATVIQKVRIEE